MLTLRTRQLATCAIGQEQQSAGGRQVSPTVGETAMRPSFRFVGV